MALYYGALVFLSLSCFALGANITRAVDDLFGGDEQIRIRYTQGWLKGQGCLTCFTQPDASKAYDGTWHDGQSVDDREPTVFQVAFEGNGIAVFGILAPDSLANFSFVLDDEDAGRYIYPSDIAIPEFQYDISYYENNSLTYGSHTLTMTVDGYDFNGRQGNSLALLDYIILQYDEDRPTPSSTASPSPTSTSNESSSKGSNNVGAIAGGVVGGVVGVIACLCLVLFLFKRRQRERQRKTALLAVEAFPSSASSQGPYSEKGGSSPLEPARPSGSDLTPNRSHAVGSIGIHSKRQRANQEAQLRELQRTVEALQAQNSSASPSASSSPETDARQQDAGLVEQIRRLQEEMREIRQQQDVVAQENAAPPMYVEATSPRSA